MLISEQQKIRLKFIARGKANVVFLYAPYIGFAAVHPMNIYHIPVQTKQKAPHPPNEFISPLIFSFCFYQCMGMNFVITRG